jgi:hypothetical protein
MARSAADTLPPWGWLEWYWVAQSALQGLLFIPGFSVLRTLVRISSFVICLIAWGLIRQSGRRAPQGTAPFPPATWLAACGVWLALSVFHPTANSFLSACAQSMMYIAVLSPVFWVPAVFVSTQQIPRFVMIMLVTNAVSAMMGIGQVYRPATFNPPVIMAVQDENNVISRGALIYKASDGREIVRPCGLSDNPGVAGSAGMIICLVGLCVAAQPIGLFKRLICFGLAFIGMGSIYFCQVRTMMVMELVCIVGAVNLFMARGQVRQATFVAVSIVAITFVGAAWAVSAVGDVGTKRFMTLVETRPDELYNDARGSMVRATFEFFIWEYPLGAGPGRWGQAYGNFGDHSSRDRDRGPLWAEVQWPAWVFDGGIPLMVMYVTAMMLAMISSVRVVLRCKDTMLAYWGAIICALNLSILATTFSQCPFVANTGIGFWIMASMLHAAGERSRLRSSSRPPDRGAGSRARQAR